MQGASQKVRTEPGPVLNCTQTVYFASRFGSRKTPPRFGSRSPAKDDQQTEKAEGPLRVSCPACRSHHHYAQQAQGGIRSQASAPVTRHRPLFETLGWVQCEEIRTFRMHLQVCKTCTARHTSHKPTKRRGEATRNRPIPPKSAAPSSSLPASMGPSGLQEHRTDSE